VTAPQSRSHRRIRAVVTLATLLATSCGGSNGNAAPPADIPRKRLEVVRSYAHDPTAWTQGLLVRGNRVFESTGLRGRSTLREIDLATGDVARRVDLPGNLFAEGLASVGDRLIQLTWTSGIARVYDRQTFDLEREHRYTGEGWGLCYDGTRLVMSNGSSRLFFRDPETFELRGEVEVRQSGEPLDRLNELECVNDRVYANVLSSDWIYEIDPETGAVTAAIDASGLLGDAERANADVLNGIAYRAGGDTFLVTGKFWPRLFEVRFVPPP